MSNIPDICYDSESGIVDTAALHAMGIKKAGIFFSQFKSQLLRGTELKLERIFSQEQPIEVPEHIEFYTAPAAEYIKSNDKASLSKALLLMIALAGSRYPYTCHEIVFGSREEVPFLAPEKTMCEAFSRLPSNKRKLLVEILEKNRLATNNPHYILLGRMKAYASSIGKDFPRWAKELSNYSNNPLYGFDEKKTPVQVDLPKANGSSFLTGFPPMALFVTIATGLPLDYFIIQDYSGLITQDDWVLTEEERLFLGCFLCATEQGRDEAMRQVVLWNLLP